MSVKLKPKFLRGSTPWRTSKTFHGRVLFRTCDTLRRLVEAVKSPIIEKKLSRNRDLIANTPISDITELEVTLYSQCGEDGILDAVFSKIGTASKFFVEFGVQYGIECNTRFLMEKRGWTGLMMDGGDNNPEHIKKEFVTAENINDLLKKYNVPDEFDLLSIDIDGNDYWVFKKILESYSPRVVVIEYNAGITPDKSLTVQYDPDFIWDGTDYFGASLLALDKLAKANGYTLIGCNEIGGNAFFVRDDQVKDHFTIKSIDELYRPPKWKKGSGIGHPKSDKQMQEV